MRQKLEVITVSNRLVTVLGGIPFYQSSGENSGEQNTWFPFSSVSEVWALQLGWFIKPDTRYSTLKQFFPKKLALYLKDELQELKDLATRFGNYECLCLSLLIGGGFWNNKKQGSELKKFIIKNYPNDLDLLAKHHEESIKQILEIKSSNQNFDGRTQGAEVNQWLISQGSVAKTTGSIDLVDFNYTNLRTLAGVRNVTVESFLTEDLSSNEILPNVKSQVISAPGDSFLTQIYGFFTTPSLARDLLIGTGIGLIVVGAITGTLIAIVGTAGVAPLVFGTVAAATLGPVGAGFSLGAIGLGIVGFYTAFSPLMVKLFRSDMTENLSKQAPTKAASERKINQLEIMENKSVHTPKEINHSASQTALFVPSKSDKDKKFIIMFQQIYTDWDKQTKIAINILSTLGIKIATKEFGGHIHTPLFNELQKDFVTPENPKKNFEKFDNAFKKFKDFIGQYKKYENFSEVEKLFKVHEKLVAIKDKYNANKPELTAVFNKCNFCHYSINATKFTQ